MTLNWSDPSDATITRWEYQQKTGGNFGASWTAIPSSGATTTSYTVGSLTNGTAYTFRIRAVSAAREGAVSDEQSATPVATVSAGVTVSTPTLTVDEGSSGTYTMRLNTEPSNTVTITVGGASGDVTVDPASLTFTTTNYAAPQTVRVSAGRDEDTATDTDVTLTHSASGGGYGSVTIASVVVSVAETTPTLQLSTDPAAVTEGTAITLTVTSDRAVPGTLPVSLTLSDGGSGGFAASDIPGGLGPRTFNAAFNGGTTGTVTIPTNRDSDTDEGAETYSITLNDVAGYAVGADVTAAGTLNDGAAQPTGGGGSGSGGGSAPPSVPAAPTGVGGSAASTSAGNGQVTLTWANPGDPTIRKWQVRRREIGSPTSARLGLEAASYRPGGNQAQQTQDNSGYGEWTDIPGSTASTTSHTVTGLTNGKTYGFRIRAVNAAGRPGLPSTEIRVTLRQPPLKPTGVTATAGDGQVTLTWDNPDDATISKWQYQQKQADGAYGPWMDVPNSTASTTRYTVTGLTNGTAYGFRIRAVNAGGNGAVSDEVTATPLQLPSKPTGVTATPGHGQVTLTWDNPTDATITRWQVQQKEGSGSYGPWRDIPNSTANTTSHTVTGLTNGTAYSFRIRAVNAAGPGDPSDAVTATPVHPDTVQADKARRQALAATSRTLLGMATDVLGDRTGGDAPVTLAGSGDSLGNQAMGVVENLLGIGGSELPTSLTLEEVEDRLWSQSFQLSPPAEANPSEGSASQQQSWAFWGAGELRSYRSEEEEGLSSTGNLKTAWLGVDYPFTHRGLAGLALSFSSGQSDYSYRKTDGATDGGRMDTRLTTFYPYGSFQVSRQFRLWAMAGIGWGSQHHQQTGDDTKVEGDLRLQMGVVGFEQALSPIGDVNLSLAGDAGLVKSTTAWQGGSGLGDLSVTLHRIRMGVDGSFPLAEHTTGYVNVKGRMDGGDLPMNAAELVAGVQYSQARFSGFLQGRQVYAFDGSYAESGLTAQLRLTANSDGTGLGWTLQPSYGAGNGDVALAAGPSLWTDQQLESLTGAGAAQQEGQHLEWSSRVGYGIRLESSDLLLTPFTEVRLWEGSSHRIGLGLTVEAASWNLEFSGSTEHTTNASPTGNLQLNFSKRL